MADTQEVHVTVRLEIGTHAKPEQIARAVKAVFDYAHKEVTIVKVAEERHIYGTAEDGDVAWRP